MPDGVTDAPWLTVGPSAAFVAGPKVGLMAFRLGEDGTLLWSSSHVSALPPVAFGETVITIADNGLVAVRQDRDEVAWRRDLGQSPQDVFVMGDRVGVVSGQELRTFDTQGSPGWRLALGAAPATPFVFDSGVTFVGLADGSLAAIDVSAGTIRRRTQLPARPEFLASAGARVYLSTANGHLYSFERTALLADARLQPAGPKPKWDYAKIRAIGQPAVGARSVYFTLLNNILYAFAQGGGSERWHTALPDRPVSGPLLLGDSVAVALADGRVMEVRSDGHVRHPATAPTLPPALTLQSAAGTPDRTGVVTVGTAQDFKRVLMAWGLPKGTAATTERRPIPPTRGGSTHRQ